MEVAIAEDARDQRRSAALLKALGLDKVPPEQREITLAIAKRYELDPLLRHIMLVDGRPYITRDGLLWVAHRSGQFDGIEVDDPEMVELPGLGQFWRSECRVYRKDMSRPIRYPGRYPVKGQNARYGPEMAIKVAEVMALRRAFNVSAPVIEERWDIDTTAPAEPLATVTETIAARRAAITSGPAPLVPREAGTVEAVRDDPQGEPPPPEPPLSTPYVIEGKPEAARSLRGIEKAYGVTYRLADIEQARTPDAESPITAPSEVAADGAPPSAPSRCEGFSPELGPCKRAAGHTGNHANKDRESWA